MPKTKRSLAATFLVNMIVLTFISIAVFAYLWIYHEYKRFAEESALIRREYVESQKMILKNEVEKAISYIYYKNSLTEKRLRESVRERVYEAHSIAENIYNENKESKSDPEIKKMIKDALRPIRFNHGRGYYYATNLNGTMKLLADNPEMEGKSVLEVQDARGRYLTKDVIRIVRESGEGFYRYNWTKPNAQGRDFPKISFVKYFKHYDWLIGTGEYLDDVKKDIQAEVLKRLAEIRFGKQGYLFGSTYNGEPLFTNGKITLGSESVWNLTDPNGVRIIQEQRKIVENPEGGFVHYTWKKLTSPELLPKISFIKGVPEWEWMVGTGAYTDEIENIITRKKQELKQRIKNYIIRIIFTLAVLLIFNYLIAKYISARLKTSFNTFSSFFESAATESLKIEHDVHFAEFEMMAFSANKMTDERRRVENYLDNILNSSPSAIIGIDAQGSIGAFNSAAERLFGIPASQARERAFAEVLPDYAEYLQDIKQVIQSKKPLAREKIRKQHDKEICYKNISVYPLISDDMKGAVLRIDDVTERIRIEEIMIQTEKMMSVGGLAAGMAHEINNPLAGILQSAQNILRRISPELLKNIKTARECGTDLETIHAYLDQREIVKFLKGIRESGERAANIVNNMLQFSRSGESKKTSVNLAELIDKTVELASHDYDLKKKYDFRHIEIIRDFDPDLPEVCCIATEIEQVILNLLRNAAQAMAGNKNSTKHPRIRLSIKREGHMASIAVEDNGPGMDEKVRKRIFEPFFTTKEVGTGTGLGLSVSYFIITSNHKGTMTAESYPGGENSGTKFVIRLPLEN